MSKIYQQTITQPVSFEGVGLHSGIKSKVTILPGGADQGIIFKRTDLKEDNIIKANYKNVSSTKLCTILENEKGVKVSTVEHLLAALYIAEIDNAVIEINNIEVPIMDGSAKDFLAILDSTELKELNSKRRYLKIISKVEMIDNGRKISIEPLNDSLEVDFQLNYKNKIIGNQKNKINMAYDNLDKMSEARTFCLYEDIEKIKKQGLAKGGSLENAIVVDQDKILNKGGLRNSKEFVNHKILDLVGDFLLSGKRILGKVSCFQGGHQLSNMFLKTLFKSKASHKVVQIDEINLQKTIKTNSITKLAVNA